MKRHTRCAEDILIIVIALTLTVIAANPAMLKAEEDSLDISTKPVFVTVAYPVQWSESNTLLLVESIRSFGGALAESPVWCFVPDYGKQPSEPFKQRMSELHAELIPFEIDKEIARFFFAADIRAAALAESTAIGKTQFLCWLASNTIVLREPTDFILAADKNLGYRPVHHTNIGSIFDEPVDEFWTLVYRSCMVPEHRIFPMKTHVDANVIRPYFNAGILVTRPDNGLFKRWHDAFSEVYKAPEFAALYEKDERYTIFIHQAILSGVILAFFGRGEIQELPPAYNYPMHLSGQDSTAARPTNIGDLVTVRYEDPAQIPDWLSRIAGGDPFKKWFDERVKYPE